MAKYKATAYIRLSYTDDRSSESDSVSNQRKLIENFVERNPDIEVVSYKVDDGYSGIIFDRPAFKEMMQDVTNGEINCVIHNPFMRKSGFSIPSKLLTLPPKVVIMRIIVLRWQKFIPGGGLPSPGFL